MMAGTGGNGLRSSRWAPSNFANSPSYIPRVGDWACPSCSFSNFASRQICLRCSFSKPTSSGAMGGSPAHLYRENTPSQESRLRATSSPPPPYTAVANHTRANPSEERFRSGEYGLATSRWAPRNAYRNGSVGGTGKPQIWTRTVSISKSSSEAFSNSQENNPQKASNLGLPYEVQHYILTMMERILEEGCFDFALRLIPRILHEKNYTCSEAVELSQWRKLLPESISNDAVNPVSGYSLEKALIDAVRIRNSAQHRHLCDNDDIRRMATQAHDLMSMFSDTMRQRKFLYLRSELEEWDKLSAEDQQSAKSRLQFVLQQISENPVSDMDWTPNAVSLEEVGAETTISVPTKELEEQYVDEMELD